MTKVKKNPYGIKTPTSVDEFRENLRKYYLTIPHPTKGVDYGKKRGITMGGRNDYPIDCYSLNVKETGGLMIKDLSSFSDIYKNTETGFRGDGTSPSICPLLTFNKDVGDYMGEKKQWTSDGYFEDESNYKIWTNDENNFLSDGDCKWFTLDNQWLRDYYMMTLGEYSGYDYEESKVLS